jgi:hypothetical protein
MAKFFISPALYPGVYRTGGFYKSGETVELEQLDGCLSLKLIPLDAGAYEALVAKFGAEAVQKSHGEGPVVVEEEKKQDDRKTLAELAKDSVAITPAVVAPKSKKHGRAADH